MTKTTKCRRCNGTGLVFTDRVCFGCNGAGHIVADKFLRIVGTTGEFFGVTGPVAKYGVNAGKQSKGILRAVSGDALANNVEAGATVQQITEEQARKFFDKYGVTTQVQA
jgi:DnaJ-class molecular chaperone